MNTRYIFILLIFALGTPQFVFSASHSVRHKQLQVVALFKDTAIIRYGSAQQRLRVGEQTPNGIRLVTANSEYAVFQVGTQRVKQSLGSYSTIKAYSAKKQREIRIPASDGHYATQGTINGKAVRFLVDTGASYISMNAKQAKQLGIDYQQGRKTIMNTANGRTGAYVVNLSKVRIGGIEKTNIQAAVLENIATDKILLGMSFLNKVSMSNNGGVMFIREHR